MPAEALIGSADVLQGKAVLLYPLAELEELSLHGSHGGPTHFSQDPTGLGQNELGFQKYDSIGDRLDFGLALVELDS